MSDRNRRFISHLQALAERDRGALAALRRSLGFAPGTFAAAMPAVEPFVAQIEEREATRLALYMVAGLFAANPRQREGRSLAQALAEVQARRASGSIERRFMALLAADADALPVHLRHLVSLLAAEEQAYDHAQLIADLSRWIDPWRDGERDRVRQRWARDFYRSAMSDASAPVAETRLHTLSHEDQQ